MAEQEEKQFPIILDDKSLEIIKGVHSVHRHSLVNIGLALVSKTPYYKTLTGEAPEELDEIASLDSLESDTKEVATVKETKQTVATKPKTVSFDDF